MKTKNICFFFLSFLFVLPAIAQNFEDDFAKEKINEMPSKWSTIKGDATIALVDQKKTIALKDNTIVTPKVNGSSTNYLGEEFTMELDLFFDEAATAYRQFYKIRLWEGSGNFGFDGNHTDPLIIYRHGIRAAGSYKSYNKLKELEVNERVWRQIKLVYKKGTLSISINGEELYSNPDLFYKPQMASIGVTLHNSVPLTSAFANFSLIGNSETSTPNNSQINFNSHIEGKAHEMLKKLLPKGIQSFSFAPNGGWVIITKTNEHFARNIPIKCYDKIKEFVQKGTLIKEVVFPPMGGANSWLIITENSTFASNIPPNCYNKITELQSSGKVIQSVSFPHENIFNSSNDAWSILTTDGNFYVKNIPDECYQIMRNIRQTDMPGKSPHRKITKVSFGPANKWVVMAEDYFFFMNMPQDYIRYFNTIKAQEYSPEIIAFDPDREGWSVTSDKSTVPLVPNLIRNIENNINDRDIWQTMSAKKVPGVAIAVVINGKIAWQTAYGHLIKNEERFAAHPESMFQAASISKVFAAAGALKLLDQGKLTLDGDIVASGKLKWDLPFDDCINNEIWVDNFNEITVRNILNHRSGIQGVGSGFDNACNYSSSSMGGYSGYTTTIPTLKELMQDIEITYHPNKRPSPNDQKRWYSGKAFTVLQKLINDVTGKRFPFWMRDEILRPLNMEESEFTVYPEQHYEIKDFARGHNSSADTIFSIQRYPQYAAAGLYSNAGELANFLIMLNDNGKFKGKTILKETTSKLLVNGTGMNTSDDNITVSSKKFYAHGGSNKGFRAYMIGFPELVDDPNGIKSAGIVVLTNGDVTKLRYDIANAIIREYGW